MEVDAVRTRRQVEPVLNDMLGSRLVYLGATERTRRQRFEHARITDAVKRSMSFDEAMRHPTEREALILRSMAHLVIDTDDLPVTMVASEIRAWLSWPRASAS